MSEQNPMNVEPPSTGRTQLLGIEYRWATVICYVPIVPVMLVASIALLATEPKSNKLVRFHAMQALGVCGAAVAVSIINFVLCMCIPLLGPLLMGVGFNVIHLVVFILCLYGMFRLYKGNNFEIPYIAEFARRFA
jgi:uncharacterized membrane protein